MRREERGNGIGISMSFCFAGVQWSQEVRQLSYPATMKMGKKEVYTSPCILCCCFHFLTWLLPSLLVRGCSSCFLSIPFTHTYRAKERAQPLRMTAPWGGKGSNPKSTSAIDSSCWKFPRNFNIASQRDETSEPPKLNCGRGGGMLPPLPFQWNEQLTTPYGSF